MGGSQSRPAAAAPKTIRYADMTVPTTDSSLSTDICASEPIAIQYALQDLPEFKNQYTIKINNIANVPNNNLQCDVNFIYSSAETGFTKNEKRRITFKTTEDGDPVVESISQRLNELTEQSAVSPKEVLDYYDTLHKYNSNWISTGWKLQNTSYNPPMPLWDDPIFMKNIEIYNNNYKAVINKILGSAYKEEAVNLFKTWISPVPADPIPPKASKVLLPLKPITASGSAVVDEAAINAALATESKSAVQNAETIALAKDTYNSYNISTNSPVYDPPLEGDTYETILIKLIKAYDYAASENSNNETSAFFSSNRDIIKSDSDPDKFDRRLVGRYTLSKDPRTKFKVPSHILPTNYKEIIDYSNSVPYKFNERQQYLIDYTPVSDASDLEKLKVNFCKSLGFQRWSGKCSGPASDCCAQLQDLPKYSGSMSASGSASGSALLQPQPGSVSVREQFVSASASASASAKKKCGVQLGGRTLTVSVPAPPVNIDTSNRMFTYKMSRPTNGTCKPAPTPKPSPDELYDVLRPVFLKELQTTIKNNKMFELRCPGSCLK